MEINRVKDKTSLFNKPQPKLDQNQSTDWWVTLHMAGYIITRDPAKDAEVKFGPFKTWGEALRCVDNQNSGVRKSANN